MKFDFMGIYQDLEAWSAGRVQKISKEYKDQQDTGALSASVSSEIVKTDSGYQVLFKALDYAYQKEYGRGKTKNRTKSDFFEKLHGWVSRHWAYKNEKDLRRKTYALWRHIHEKGIKVPNKYNTGNLVGQHINEEEVKKLLESLGSSMVEDIKETLFNQKQWR